MWDKNEWVDWAYGALMVVLAILLATALSGCASAKPMIVERVRTDTIRTNRAVHDTIVRHDSVAVETVTRGDTVYRTREVWRWRDRVSVRTDTVRVSVKATENKETPAPHPTAKKVTWWERWCRHVGKAVTILGGVCLVSIVLWTMKRKRGK